MKIAFKVDATVGADDAVDAVDAAEVGTRAYATAGAGTSKSCVAQHIYGCSAFFDLTSCSLPSDRPFILVDL